MISWKMNKTKLILIIAFLVFTAVTFIHPVYPREQFLQHAGTVLLLIPLIADLVAVNGTDSEAFKTKANPIFYLHKLQMKRC